VFVVVVVLPLYLLSYLFCIHCGRVSFIVVFCVLCLIECVVSVMCLTCLLCTCCTTATGLKPICSQIINIYIYIYDELCFMVSLRWKFILDYNSVHFILLVYQVYCLGIKLVVSTNFPSIEVI
jgi:hypothetical protein